MISLTSVQSCVSSVYCMSLLLIVFIVAPMQQHTVESKDHKHTNLPRRETPRSLWETPWYCSSTRCRSWDLDRSEGNGKSSWKVWTLWEWRTASSILHKSPRADCLTITTSTHTSRNRSAICSTVELDSRKREEVTFVHGRRTQWGERDAINTPLLWQGTLKRIHQSEQVFGR